jgi:hypothetical protein
MNIEQFQQALLEKGIALSPNSLISLTLIIDYWWNGTKR